MENFMRITVAVCTYKRFELLHKCLESLKNQSLPKHEYMILVVDNSLDYKKSEEFRDSLKEFSNLEYLITDRAGIGYARTVAMDNCRTEFLAYTDDDCVVPSDWLENILIKFSQHCESIGVLGGPVRPKWEIQAPGWLDGSLSKSAAILDWGDNECFVDNKEKWLLTANAAYRIRALRVAGGFSSHLGRLKHLPFAHEELAANKAIHSLGFDLLYSPDIFVEHFIPAERMTQKYFCLSSYLEGASVVLMKHKDLKAYEMDKIVSKILPKVDGLINSRTDLHNKNELEKEIDKYRTMGWSDTTKVVNKLSLEDTKEPTTWPVIYIVSPSLNSGNTIDRTILSVVTQSGDFSIRYHVQDGGSTDETLEKLEAWKKRLSNPNPFVQCKNVVFTFDSSEDGGMYSGVRKGFDSMHIPQDAFMTWINADDILMQHTLSTVISVSCQISEVQWLGGTVTALYMDENFMVHYPVGFPRSVISEGLCDGIHWQTLQQEGMFWRKWVWDKVGGVNTNFKYAGDWDLWRRFAQHVEFTQIPWTLGVFHSRKGQLSNADSGNAYQEEINSILPINDRQLAIRNLSDESRNALGIAVVAGNFNSKRYFIRRLPLGGRMPDQAKEFFKKDMKNNDCIDSESSFEDTFNLTMPKRTFINNRMLRRIFHALPFFIQQKLRWIKKNIVLPIKNMSNNFRMYLVISKSKLFFASYYYENYRDVADSGKNALLHYIRHGGKEGRTPNPLFDSEWYLRSYPDVAANGTNPLFHYIKYGQFEGRNPGPHFSTVKYLEMYPDVKEVNINPLLHYLKCGIIEGRKIHSV
jgi:glycosyltransferase involved in cell wall biosynthesis